MGRFYLQFHNVNNAKFDSAVPNLLGFSQVLIFLYVEYPQSVFSSESDPCCPWGKTRVSHISCYVKDWTISNKRCFNNSMYYY